MIVFSNIYVAICYGIVLHQENKGSELRTVSAGIRIGKIQNELN